MAQGPWLELMAVQHGYPDPAVGYRRVLARISLTVQPGEILLLRGPSGSGKSTLAHVLALWERPASGAVTVAGTPVRRAWVATRMRGRVVAYVPQHLALVPEWTVWATVLAALRPFRLPAADTVRRVWQALAAVDLLAWRTERAGQLSGGQQQRLALARALACEAPVLVADEVTRSLDPALSARIREVVRTRVAAGQGAAVWISHDPADQALANRELHLEQGVLR
ncbi:MAG: ATP-binding cassette domain-containing protein [Firmicutes bacterium]|nr:ATP-binding cassette domain-containing protein [Bacillota bacterium]